jgi:hypothetical protein
VQAHVEKLVVELGARLGEELRVYLDKVAKGLADARAKGQVFYREYDDPPPSAQSQLPAPASSARVFFLTDGRCGSACLDFADVLYLVPGVVHVGLPTYADTQYMEVRPAPLPSGIAVLHLATKVWRNRPRGNEPYVPKHRFTGDIADTAALEVWILTL